MNEVEIIRQIHHLSSPDVLVLLSTRCEGLTCAEVQDRIREFGQNTIEQPRRRRWIGMLVRHFTNFFSLLLIVSAVLSFFAEWLRPGESMLVLGYALFGVAILNGLFAFAQEYRADRAMEELRKLLPPRVTVRRDGTEQTMPAAAIVPGDIIIVQEGCTVPADARLVEARDLLLSNAVITGESRPKSLTSDPAKGRLSEASNIIFAGCTILRGSGEAVVFATGPRTEFGKIAALSHNVQRAASPLEREVNRMIRILTVIAVTMGVLFFVYGMISEQPLLNNIVFMLGIIVANVPEGLLPTITLALTMGSLRMARKNTLVKSLESIESLGSMHVICTDKTGTLTKNELALAAVVDPLTGVDVLSQVEQKRILQLAVVASDLHGPAGAWTGDPLDVVVTRQYDALQGNVSATIDKTVRHFPFDVRKRRQAGLLQNNDHLVYATKGAWEALRPLIRSITTSDGNGEQPVDGSQLALADQTVHRLAAQGYRVIAVASRQLELPSDATANQSVLEKDLVLQGFLTFEDPIRPEVPDAVRQCHRAKIRVLLITGDHPDTAFAVAQRIGIVAEGVDARTAVLHGDELERLREDVVAERLRSGVAVFARTNPEQKMKIVMAVKRLGLVVGMTGDGVNDAPALKAADVGIAMGIGGTDVAREAADIVLLDDNFASIVAGIAEGRTIFRNIQKFIDYVLASNVPEIVPYLLYIIFPVPLALTILQILSIDLGTDILPAIGLGQEPPESDVMEYPPRRSDEGLLTKPLLMHAYLFFGPLEAAYSLTLFFCVLALGGWHYGEELDLRSSLYHSATGITLATVVLMQIANLISRRSARRSGLDRGLLKNRLILLGIAIETLFAWSLLFWPPMQRILSTGPVPWWIFAMAWLGVPIGLGADYAQKRFWRRAHA